VALLIIPFVQHLFLLTDLPVAVIISCIVVALVSTGWIEIWKMVKKNKAGY
jgi:hypothetical protein